MDYVAVFTRVSGNPDMGFQSEINSLKAKKIISIQTCCGSNGRLGEVVFFLTIHYTK